MWCRSLVAISTKLRPPSVEVWSKFRPNFDTPSVEVWLKFGRSLVEVRSKFGRSLVSQFGKHVIKFTMCFIDIPSKLRPNFDTGGVEVWSEFRPNFDPPVSKLGLIDDDRNNQTIACFVEQT